MRHIYIIAAIVGLVFAGPVAAQTSGRQALAERYVQLSLIGMDKMMQEQLDAQIAQWDASVPAEQARWFRRHALPIMETHMQPMIVALTSDYAERFTEAELGALVAFYETPMGRGIARKQMEAGMEQGELLQQFEVAYLTDLMTKFCAQFDCEGAAPKGDAAGKPSRR
ncbi:DUF2059 domain-containing protein [Brevundimonas pondensis]|uniref:DUF2059 domain-containing protein n=1 Tax=Brevundimonas pondensis TaxID=2774189 RepID=UPI0028D1696D|nr:DUF2059 domain-containing protein [uncultured Brevundimonas sp.]